jgi:ankyrin repeat protein
MVCVCVQYYGEGVLHLAVWGGNGAVAPLLPYCVKKGISVDARSLLQRTPLHHAAMHGNNTMIDALLGQGAGEHTHTDPTDHDIHSNMGHVLSPPHRSHITLPPRTRESHFPPSFIVWISCM